MSTGRGNDDAFYADVTRDASDAAFALGLQRMSETLSPITPPPSLRARLLASAPPPARFARFANRVAELLDVDLPKAQELIARIDDASAWVNELPGVSFLWVEGGPRVAAAVRGFIRIEAGRSFPLHEHLGEEITFVLQGSFEDLGLGVVNVPGDVRRMGEGTSHEFRALPGLDLLMLAVAHNGLRARGRTYAPR